MTENIKPPQGLKPKFVHDGQRLIDVSGAISRYLDVRWQIPSAWIEEYNELIRKELQK